MFFASKKNPGLAANGPYAPFSAGHIMLMLAAFAVVFMLIRMLRRTRPHTRRAVLIGAAALLVALNAARLVWEVRVGDFDVRTSLPLQLCGLQMFVLPAAIFARGAFGRAMRAFAFSYGTVGAFLALLLPLTTMYDYPLWHFRTLHTFVYHAVMGAACLMLPLNGYTPTLTDMKPAYAVLISVAAATGIINALIGSNYLYSAHLPLPRDVIPWPWYLPLLLAFALLAGRIPMHAARLMQRRPHAIQAGG